MSDDTSFCGIILAAGASSRMGCEKALLPWPPTSPANQTLLSAAVLALRPFAPMIIVVVGNNADRLAPAIKASGAILIRNPAPERGQFSSLQTGLSAAVDSGCRAAMITPVDCPPLSSASLERLCAAYEQAAARGMWAVAPEQDGRRGHPLIAGRPLIDAFLDAPLTSNAREVKHQYENRFEFVSVPDPFLRTDLNTPEEFDRAIKQMATLAT